MILILGLTLACVVTLMLLFWKQHNDLACLEENYNQLREQNLGLLNNSLRPQPVATSPAVPTPSRMPAKPISEAVSGHPSAPSPHPEKPLLILTNTEVHQTSTGLVAVMHFKSSIPTPEGLGTSTGGVQGGGGTGAKPHATASTEQGSTSNGVVSTGEGVKSTKPRMGLVAMSVRIPSDVDATIQSLTPVNTTLFSDSEITVSENGRFAFFQGTAENPNDVEIALSVSSAVRAFIKGTAGINAMQLDIQ